MSNPYAPTSMDPMPPPGFNGGPNVGTGSKVYSAGQVALATFLGSIIAGAVLMAINDRRLGQAGKVVGTLIVGVVGTLAVLGIAFALPEEFPGTPISVVCVVIMYQYAKVTQSKSVEMHLVEGGRQASSWAAAGIGLLCGVLLLVGVLAVAIGLAILMPDLPMFAE